MATVAARLPSFGATDGGQRERILRSEDGRRKASESSIRIEGGEISNFWANAIREGDCPVLGKFLLNLLL